MLHYLALGDSISIDDYTGIKGGGAASQFAAAVSANPFQDLAIDGHMTFHVLNFLDIGAIRGTPDLITLTIGGNDLLELACYANHVEMTVDLWLAHARKIVSRVESIVSKLMTFRAVLIMNTVYDPSDGNDEHFKLMYPLEARSGLREFNAGIRRLAAEYGARLSDLEGLFAGHGHFSADPWVTDIIEPNLPGASQIAKHWVSLTEGQLSLP